MNKCILINLLRAKNRLHPGLWYVVSTSHLFFPSPGNRYELLLVKPGLEMVLRREKEEDVDVHKYTSAIRCLSAAFFIDKGTGVEIQHPINELSQWVETGDGL